jgi:hypothetical protein
MLLPNLATVLSDKEEPQWLKLRIETLDPARTTDRTESEEDICVCVMTLSCRQDPTAVRPHTLSEEPARTNWRQDRDEPKLTKFSTLDALPNRDAERMLTVLARLAKKQVLSAFPNRPVERNETVLPITKQSKTLAMLPSLLVALTEKVLAS